jgi:hypothetical protein
MSVLTQATTASTSKTDFKQAVQQASVLGPATSSKQQGCSK